MAHQNCEIGRCKKASAAERHPAETRRAQDVPSSDQVPSGDLSITINRITSSTFSRTSTKPFRSCSLDRAHVAAPIPAAVVTNTIWFAFTRTISPSGRCRSSQPVVAARSMTKRLFQFRQCGNRGQTHLGWEATMRMPAAQRPQPRLSSACSACHLRTSSTEMLESPSPIHAYARVR